MRFNFIPPVVKEVDNPNCLKHQDPNRLVIQLQVRHIFFVLYVLELTYIVLSTTRFFYYRQYYKRLQKRCGVVVFTTAVGAILQGTTGLLSDAIFFPCYVKYAFLILSVPLATFAPVLRLLDFYNKYVLAVAIQRSLHDDKYSSNDDKGQMAVVVVQTEVEIKAPSKSRYGFCRALALLTHVREFTKLNETRADTNFDFTMELVAQLKFLSSERVKLYIILVILCPYLIFIIIAMLVFPQLDPANGCILCNANLAGQIVVILGGLIGVSWAIVFALLLRDLSDPFEILRENLLFGICGIFTLLGFFLRNIVPDTGSSDIWSMAYLPWFGYVMLHVITTDYQVYRAKKLERTVANSTGENGKKKSGKMDSTIQPASSITSAPPAIPKGVQQCLANPQFLPLFEKHMITEFSAEILRMYMDCLQFEKNYYDMTEQSRKARAKKIIMMHVEDNAVMQVNLPFSIKTELISQIETDRIAVGMFGKAESELIQMMRGCFNRFIKTKLFIQLRDEILKSEARESKSGIIANMLHSIPVRVQSKPR